MQQKFTNLRQPKEIQYLTGSFVFGNHMKLLHVVTPSPPQNFPQVDRLLRTGQWTSVGIAMCQRILHGCFVCLARTSRLYVTSTEVAGERMLSKKGLPPCYFLNILSRWAWNKPLQRTCWTRRVPAFLIKWFYCEKTCRY